MMENSYFAISSRSDQWRDLNRKKDTFECKNKRLTEIAAVEMAVS
jgi:hypothetical protein